MSSLKFSHVYLAIALLLTVLCVGCSASRPAPIKDQSSSLSKPTPVVVVPNWSVTNSNEVKPPPKTVSKSPTPAENKKTVTDTTKPVTENPPVKSENREPIPPFDPNFRIGKPSNGPVLDGFNGTTNKGIEYGGKIGDPVVAAAEGNVIFSGNSLRSYGNLVIVKHNNSYISVYAHNSKNLVKEGDTIKRGQKIAEMGNSETDRVKLHFELRRESKPIDPSGYFDN